MGFKMYVYIQLHTKKILSYYDKIVTYLADKYELVYLTNMWYHKTYWDKAYIVMQKVPYDVIQKGKIGTKKVT